MASPSCLQQSLKMSHTAARFSFPTDENALSDYAEKEKMILDRLGLVSEAD
jgi:hypothetical protein